MNKLAKKPFVTGMVSNGQSADALLQHGIISTDLGEQTPESTINRMVYHIRRNPNLSLKDQNMDSSDILFEGYDTENSDYRDRAFGIFQLKSNKFSPITNLQAKHLLERDI